ncbi:MAG TPA: YwbE family protein [Epsilonproteobacteria bacterium]|nr:YwbE family protein [Campylobacterota bacterium]HHD78997.1 YwbE family protein [Campylobacterota bacterium]
MAEGQKRADIKYGMNVGIVLKEDQSTGYITYGKVQKILTNSPTHPHGIKVRLSSGEVGRVKEFVR